MERKSAIQGIQAGCALADARRDEFGFKMQRAVWPMISALQEMEDSLDAWGSSGGRGCRHVRGVRRFPSGDGGRHGSPAG